MTTNSNRFPYLTATSITQGFLDDCQDSLTCNLELIVEIERPDGGYIYASDRNKYLGGTFYEALTNFPIIKRTIGDWLVPQVEFSDLEIEVSNVDGRYNSILPGGANYSSWINKSIKVALCLREEVTSRIELFEGFITEQGGVERTINSVKFTARDKGDKVNRAYPQTAFSKITYPNLTNDLVGRPVPIIYGDWTTAKANPVDVKTFIVNGLDPFMNGTVANTTNAQCIISNNANTYLDTGKIYLVRADEFYMMSASDIVNVNANKNYFEVVQNGSTSIDGSPYLFEDGDEFYVNVKGKDLGSYSDNAVWIARDILISYGGLSASDFDANWATYRDKATPSQSNIAGFKFRVWRQDEISIIDEVLSLLEQVRLEVFIDRNLKFKISSLHFEDFIASPSFSVTNYDIERGSFIPMQEIQNQINRAKTEFNYLPSIDGNYQETNVFRNQAAITAADKIIDKRIIAPNMYFQTEVESQLQEILRLSSSYIEVIEFNSTWRGALLDIGDFIKMNVRIQSTQYTDVPCLIREIGFDPNGPKIFLKVWSFITIPFPGWAGVGSGITGGYNATITQE